MIIAIQTAAGHSIKNPAERVDCILNLGLYGMEIMHKKCTNQQNLKKKT